MWPLQLISHFFDLTLRPFQSVSPVWAVSVWSLLTSLVMLLVFRSTSNQQRIKETKNTIKAYILELWLFKDDLWVMLSAQRHILRLNGRYLALTLKPMLILIVPLVLMLLCLEGWFGSRPLHPGEKAIVSVQASDTEAGLLEQIVLEAHNGITVETPPLRIPHTREVNWRIRADEPGVHQVTVNLSDRRVEKQAVVAQGLARISPTRFSSPLWQSLLSPGESPLLRESGIQRIDIQYPQRSVRVFQWQVHWLVYFFVLTILFAFALRRTLGVEL